MTNARRKGADGEREFCRRLAEHLGAGVLLVRNLEQSRSGGHDLTVKGDDPVSLALDRYAIEVKRRRAMTPAMLAAFWCQAERQAAAAGKLAALAYRADRQDWRVMVPLAALDQAYAWPGHDYTADLTLAVED